MPICKYCGKEKKVGASIANHERMCPQNPENFMPPEIEDTPDIAPSARPLRDSYTDRFNDADKCPYCRMMNRSHRKLDEDILCCLKCGGLFASKTALSKWQGEAATISWTRPDTRRTLPV